MRTPREAWLPGIALLLLSPAVDIAEAGAVRPVVFVHASVVAMDADHLLPDQTIVVSGGRIRELGPSGRVAVPPGTFVVDAAGRYISPGLADMHVHLYTPQELDLYLVSGVTTVFNLDGRPPHLKWRREIADGEREGPSIYSAGPMFNRPRSSTEAVAEVDRQAGAGYDAVKIYNQVSAAEYPALMAEAKRRGLILVGHVPREPGFAATLAAGQSIAHAEEYVYTFFNDDPDPANEVVHPLDTMKIPRAVAMSKQAGIFVIPTLVAFHNIVRQAEDVRTYLRDPNLAYLAPSMRDQLEPARNTYANRFPAERVPGLAVSYEVQRQLVKALQRGGVPIVAGTDAAWLGVPGFSLVEEIENFQDLGFTPYEALRTATTDAARLLRREDEFGKVAVGMRADLILTSRNPLEDVRNLRTIEGVMVRGHWIPDAERRRRLAVLPDAHREDIARRTKQAQMDLPALDAYLAGNDPLGVISSEVVTAVIASRGTEAGVALLTRMSQADPSSPMVSEEALNQLGYDLLATRRQAAIQVFELNTVLYPKSGNTFDSLAEAYLLAGKKDQARKCYARALEVQPDYPNAKAARAIVSAPPQ
jgi:imidazolonepropionase-like amidohydrolase